MKKSLLDFIVCPSCGSKLNAGKVAKDEIMSGTLKCRNNHSFPITKGVPSLLMENALAGSKEEVRNSFGEKWTRIPDFGHDNPQTREYLLQWYLERYSWKNETELKKFLATRQRVLDAGMGAGGDVSYYAENTKGQVFGIDISTSVESAYKHLSKMPNVHLIQTDLTRMPFPKGTFDFIVSHGVLHHTRNTEKSFKYLVDFLAPDGQIAIYVYKKKSPIRESCDDFIRGYTTKMTPEECYKFPKAVTRFGKSLQDLKVEIEVPETIPVLGIEAGKYNLQRFIFWHFLKCYWNDVFDLETNAMNVYDWYHPKDAFRHTPDEVKQWFWDAGLKILSFDVNDSGISVRGIK